ncbi:MAG: rod shape-determining protein RodA [Rhodospirillaceae bacterium]|nr:rod shape-determining protein RodA [Rhodospirillaceae bacterium]
MHIRTVMTLITTLLLLACSGQSPEIPASEPEETTSTMQQQAPTMPRTSSPENAHAYIISPNDGAEVSSPVSIVFGLTGAGIAPAGIDNPNTGHHHLLVDTELVNLNLPVPADEQNIHFGGGQTEALIELSPGQHTLQLILGDHLHIPHDPPLFSEQITIFVVE